MAKYVKKINNVTVVGTGGGGGGITTLNGLTGPVQTFTDDTNVTIVSGGTAHVVTWAGTLADGRIASASVWNGKQDGSTNLTSLSALSYVSPSFVKMTAAGTFALDTNTYLTSLSGAWLTTGNTGPSLKIGTTDNNSWDAIVKNETVLRVLTNAGTGVDYFTLRNAITADPLLITADGATATKDINIKGKGATSAVIIGDISKAASSGSTAALKIYGYDGVYHPYIDFKNNSPSSQQYSLGVDQFYFIVRNNLGANASFGIYATNAVTYFTGGAAGGNNIAYSWRIGTVAGQAFSVNHSSSFGPTSGTHYCIGADTTSYNPSTGAAVFHHFNTRYLITQSGGATGVINGYSVLNSITILNVGAEFNGFNFAPAISTNNGTINGLKCILNNFPNVWLINSTGTIKSKFGGDIELTGTAKITTYAGNTTIGNGVASILGTFSVIGRTTIYTAESIMTIPATGVYEVVVAVNNTSPANFTNLTLNYTSGGVGQTHDKFNAFTIGTRATETYLISCDTSTALTFTTALAGATTHDILIYVKRIA